MTKRKLFTTSIFIFIMSLILLGCASDKASEKNTSKPAEETETGGELNFAYNAQPPTLDPHISSLISTRDIAKNIFETLLTFNSKGEITPMLADTYEVSDKGDTITFKLRENVKFHNGKDMTSADVVASMERWQELSSQAQTYLEGTTYEAVDDHTVVAKIKDPTTLDLYIFADMSQFAAIMPEEIIKEANAEGVDEIIGTGPFALKEWKQDQYIHLEKFTDYAARTKAADGLAGEKKALIDDLYFRIVADSSTRTAGIQSGEYDIANLIPQDSKAKLDADPNIESVIPFDAFLNVIFNKKEGIFTDQKARQAVNAAIKPEEILAAAYKEDTFYRSDHALIQEAYEGWYTNVGATEHDQYDVEQAKQLLAESNYDGEEIKILTSRDYEDRYNAAVVIQQSLKEIGMNATLNVMDGPTYAEAINDSENFDLYLSRFSFRANPVQYLFFIPSYSGWTNSPEIESVINDILYSNDIEAAKQYTDALHEATWSYLPIIKLGNVTDLNAIRTHVKGFETAYGPILWNVSVEK